MQPAVIAVRWKHSCVYFKRLVVLCQSQHSWARNSWSESFKVGERSEAWRKKKLKAKRFSSVKWQAAEKVFIKQKLLWEQVFLFQEVSSAGGYQRPLPWLQLISPDVVHFSWKSEWRNTLVPISLALDNDIIEEQNSSHLLEDKVDIFC